MERFLFLMYGLPGEPTASDEQTRAYNEKWRHYMGSLAQRGALEAGAPLQPSGKAVTTETVSEVKLGTPDVYGFMVVKAASLDDAIAIAREAPHMALGGTTVVRPSVSIR